MDPAEEALKLLEVLNDVKNVCEKKRNNAEVMRELVLFIRNMNQALGVLKRSRVDSLFIVMESSTPTEPCREPLITDPSKLVEDLACAAESVKQILKVPRNSWNIATLVERLRCVREVVIKSCQINFETMMDRGSQEKTDSPAHRASKAFPLSVRQNFSSIGQLREEDSLRLRALPDEIRRCLPRAGFDITPAQTSERSIFDDESSSDEIAMHTNSLGSNSVEISQTIRNHPRAIGNTETEAFFADVLGNLEVMKVETESDKKKQYDDVISEWLEDPITGEIMTDPIKCTDGRTYDRWTIIDNNLVKCPYDSSMLDFHIAFDDIDVRARLFQAFPDKEEAYRARRQGHRRKALEHARRGENRDALIKLNHVLQWNCRDDECLLARDDVQQMLQPIKPPPLPSITLREPIPSTPRSIRERIRRCRITSWLFRRRPSSPRTA